MRSEPQLDPRALQNIPMEDSHLSRLNPSATVPNRSPDNAISPSLEEPQILDSEVLPLPFWRKCLIIFTTSWVAFSASFSSTTVFTIAKEIGGTFDAEADIVTITNAGVLVAMGCSALLWSPIDSAIGRRYAYNLAILVLLVLTIGTAFAPNLQTFLALRVLSGFQGTYFHVCGHTTLARLFSPTNLGTAMGYFMLGPTLGPPLGPCVAGILVSFRSWRTIFWLQAAMLGLGLVMSLCFIPDIQSGSGARQRRGGMRLREKLNPFYVLKFLAYPDVLLTDLAVGLIAFAQYALLSPIRKTINPRFDFTTPLVAGLFYIAPGLGFLLGTASGGQLSDRTVRKWIVKRGNVRIPRDRLRDIVVPVFFVIPLAFLLYGWCLQKRFGALALPVVTAFFAGLGLTGSLPCLNTYSAESVPTHRAEIISGKFFVQYLFAALGTATMVQLVDNVGVGFACTISVSLVFISGGLTLATAVYAVEMRDWAQKYLKIS